MYLNDTQIGGFKQPVRVNRKLAAIGLHMLPRLAPSDVSMHEELRKTAESGSGLCLRSGAYAPYNPNIPIGISGLQSGVSTLR